MTKIDHFAEILSYCKAQDLNIFFHYDDFQHSGIYTQRRLRSGRMFFLAVRVKKSSLIQI